MNRLINCLVLAAAFFTTIHCQEISVTADRDSILNKQLYDLEYKLNNLLAKGDFTTYKDYLADDYVRISANGQMKTKEEVLSEFQSSTTGVSNTVPKILQIRIYGNTAIMNIHLTVTSEVMGKKTTRESLLTKVFIKRDDHWYMVSLQGTPLG